MKGKKVVALAAAATLAALTSAAYAQDASRETKIQQLEAKVAELENKQAQDGKTVAATIDAVLRDAERRSQLMATTGGSTAGYDNGFFISSGDFTLRPAVTFQFRNVNDYREETDGPKDDEIESGFEIRRLQFNLSGTAFTKDLTYAFQWNTDRNAGHMFLEDAWVRYMFADDWGFRIGQFKGPVSHEKLMSDSRIIAVERSLQDAALLGGYFDRVQGVTVIYGGYNKNNPLNVEIGLIDGANSKNTDYTGHPDTDPTFPPRTGSPSGHAFDFGVEGRAEFKFSGDWKNYADFSTQTTKEALAVLGGGFEWDQGGDGDVLIGTVDFQWEGTYGLGFYAAGVVRHIDGFAGNDGGDDDDRTDWSVLAQVTYLLNPAWEIFGRYTYLEYDTGEGGDGEDFHEVSVGVAYYLGNNGSAGHRAKVTIDLNWLPDGAPFQIKGSGYLGDSNGEDEIVIRGQFQLLI